MSKITIAFDDHTKNAFQTPVPVQIVDERLNKVSERVVLVTESTDVRVPGAGLYRVQAELPNGESVGTTVRVTDEEPRVTARLVAAQRSPRETLAWAYVQQGVRRASGFPRTRYLGITDAGGGLEVSVMTQPPRVSVPKFSRIVPAPVTGRGGGAWQLAPVDLQVQKIGDIPVEDPRLIARYVLSRPGFYGLRDEWFPVYASWSGSGGTGRTGTDVNVTTLAAGTLTELLFVRADEQQEGPVRALASGTRPEAEALLGYLEQGAFGAARRVGKDWTREATNLLREKESDPFAAAIAGYFLLRAGRLEKRDWMRNLAEWFPGVPDGAVVYGASLLRGRGVGAARQEARKYLLEAVGRGIPAYTVGLRLLFDGLRSLANDVDTDERLLEALSRVRQIAAYADWDVRATTFSIPKDGTDFPFALMP